ncbi:MAG: zinc-finger-containing protein [Lachnospiraceae bacterium]|nr:zinc-finger-containing protein [Lachnospiraceae bacterium]
MAKNDSGKLLFADMLIQLKRKDRSTRKILWDFCDWAIVRYPELTYYTVTPDMVQEHLEELLLEASQKSDPAQYAFIRKRMLILNQVFGNSICDKDIGYNDYFIMECPFCGNDFLYGEAVHNNLRCKCPVCKKAFSTHKKIPILMSASDKELLDYRKRVDTALMDLQDQKGWTVSETYAYLSDEMKLPYGRTNIGRFSLEQCKEALAAIRKLSA